MGRRSLAWTLLVAAAVLLAGCQDLVDPRDGDGPKALSQAEARAAWSEAFSNLEGFEGVSAVGIETNATADGEAVFGYRLEVQPAEAAFLLRLSIAPALMQGQQGPATELLQNVVVGQKGIHLVMPNLQGDLRLRRDHVPDQERFASFGDLNQEVQAGSADPTVGPDVALVGLDDKGPKVAVRQVRETTHRGQAAWRIDFSFRNATLEAEGTTVVYQDPRLPARAEFTMDPRRNGSATHPLFNADQATVTTEFRYDDEVQVTLPDADRAPAEIRKVPQMQVDADIAFGIDDEQDQEVPLEEIELRVTEELNRSGGPFSTPPPPEKVYLAMQLSKGSKSNDNASATYHDVDGDGYVSAGDSYRVNLSGDLDRTNVSVVFFDRWAGLYDFQPGFEAAAAVVAGFAAALALLGRRR